MKYSQVLPIISETEELISPQNFYPEEIINPKGKVYCESYFDGIEEKYYKFNGVLDGPFKSFFTNSKPYIITSYSNGKLHGKFMEFNKYGDLIKECNYSNGNLHGPYREFHPFFKTKSLECFYVGGVLHGLYSKFDDNHNTKYYECEYFNGKKIFNPYRMLLNSIHNLFYYPIEI